MAYKLHIELGLWFYRLKIITYLFKYKIPIHSSVDLYCYLAAAAKLKIKLSFFYILLQIRHRFGLYDEITVSNGRKTRHCNWVRFLKVMDSYGPQVFLN